MFYVLFFLKLLYILKGKIKFHALNIALSSIGRLFYTKAYQKSETETFSRYP